MQPSLSRRSGRPVTEPWQWGLGQAARAIRVGEISSRGLVDSLLARIDRLEPAIESWARLDHAHVRDEAARCDAEAQRGQWRGPLHGVPVGIKDNLATRGLETRAGSDLLVGHVPQDDADAVAGLRAAGALVLGKTHMTVFAAMDPAPTRNPWNLRHTPGGSSSGSAAAVAARMCAAALGSQTAGSVLRPAAYCGVAGLKPTYGTVSRRGLVPCAWSMDHVGALAREVDDLVLIFAAIAGASRGGDRSDQGMITVGVPDRYFDDATDTEVGAAFEQAVVVLEKAGARIVTVSLPPGFESLAEAGVITMYAEMAAFHRDRYAADAAEFPPRLSVLIEVGLAISAADYLRAQQIRRLETAALSRVLESVTVMVTPATPLPAPLGLDSTGDWRFNLPFSHSGHPALSVPCGLTRAGLPIGLQMVARHADEDELFRVARLLQSHSDWHRRAPPLPDGGH